MTLIMTTHDNPATTCVRLYDFTDISNNLPCSISIKEPLRINFISELLEVHNMVSLDLY